MAPLVILLAVVLFDVTSVRKTTSIATASLFVPLVAGLAPTLGLPPLVLMTVVAVAASFEFMLPVATPPNAVVFASGRLTLPQMARVGVWLNLIGVALLTGMATLCLPVVLGA